jgi:glutamine---fructose-6-phosphate transaminase (isomerizing)
MSTTAQAIRLT